MSTPRPAFIIPVHVDMFRSFEVARITGISTYTPAGLPSRAVYEVKHKDGQTDMIPVEPSANYILLMSDNLKFLKPAN